MLRYFPEPRPEELFFSIVARYSEHLRLWRRQQVQEQLFGRGNIAIGIETPRALKSLVERLPQNSNLTVDSLIDNHTLLPLYLPFISPDLRNYARKGMAEHSVRDVLVTLGRNVAIRAPNWLRFCPVCREQDQRCFGETYWRRSHQMTGVEVCATHHVFLEASTAPRTLPCSRYTLYTAKASCPNRPPREIITSNRHHRMLLGIAEDVDWILQNDYFYLDPYLLQSCYVNLMQQQCLAATENKINYGLLSGAIKDCFDDAVLDSLDCLVPADGRCKWVMRLLRGEPNALKHPLHHLVLIRALGLTAESFFSLLHEIPTKYGRGPWPCVNPVCSKYQQRTVEEYQSLYDKRIKKQCATFSCPDCSYTYLARGVIDSSEEPFTIERCQNYGELWCNRLKELWSDKNKTVQQIKDVLGASKSSLYRQAAILGLPLRKDKDVAKISRVFNATIVRAETAARSLQEKRSLWLELRKQHPDLSIKQLERMQRSLYGWLRTKDRAWLLRNRPAMRRRGNMLGATYTLKKWGNLDQVYAAQVERAAETIKCQSGRPTRVSASAICRMIATTHLNDINMIQSSRQTGNTPSYVRPLSLAQLNPRTMQHLPTTKAILEKVVEAPVEFARRRLVWAAEECKSKSINYTRYQLLSMAGVRTLVEKNPQRFESALLNRVVDQLCGGPRCNNAITSSS